MTIEIAPPRVIAGEELTITVDLAGGTGPYWADVVFSSCVTPLLHEVEVPHESSFGSHHGRLELTVRTDAQIEHTQLCTLTVTVTDAEGQSASGFQTFTVEQVN